MLVEGLSQLAGMGGPRSGLGSPSPRGCWPGCRHRCTQVCTRGCARTQAHTLTLVPLTHRPPDPHPTARTPHPQWLGRFHMGHGPGTTGGSFPESLALALEDPRGHRWLSPAVPAHGLPARLTTPPQPGEATQAQGVALQEEPDRPRGQDRGPGPGKGRSPASKCSGERECIAGPERLGHRRHWRPRGLGHWQAGGKLRKAGGQAQGAPRQKTTQDRGPAEQQLYS